jgi:hypothetical protein
VKRNVESWWDGTAPPISGCLHIIMLCRHCGSRKPRERAMAPGEWVDAEERREAKGGERAWR